MHPIEKQAEEGRIQAEEGARAYARQYGLPDPYERRTNPILWVLALVPLVMILLGLLLLLR